MSEAELVKLERDVIQARARFAGDLAVLRSPDALADFKDDVKSKALGIRDDLVEQARTFVAQAADYVGAGGLRLVEPLAHDAGAGG